MKTSPLLKSLLLITALVAAIPFARANPETFTVKSGTGNTTFKLADAKGKYVALHFLLKTECPYCLKHTHDYFINGSRLPNVVQVFVKPDTEAEIRQWAAKLPADHLEKNPIYRDPDAKLATEFGIPDGYKFHGQVVHFPATVILGPDGKEVFRYVGKNNSDRFAFEKLVAKMAELEKK